MDQRSPTYSEPDIRMGFAYLGHNLFTQLDAIDTQRKRPTITEFARTADETVSFVKKNAGERLLVWGTNERPEILIYDYGRPRSARNTDIKKVTNVLIDIDIESDTVSAAQLNELERFIKYDAWHWFSDQGFQRPAYSITGRGVHIKCTPPPISVADYPDIAERTKYFGMSEFGSDHKTKLDGLEARIDNTFDIRRMERIDGTAKPEIGYVSHFHGGLRADDEQLSIHLLGMPAPPKPAHSFEPMYGAKLLTVHNCMPTIVEQLLKRDPKLRAYWEGAGKTYGDTSPSGYDMSVVRALMVRGVTDTSDLASALACRPNGSVQKSGKGEDYIRRTIARGLAGGRY